MNKKVKSSGLFSNYEVKTFISLLYGGSRISISHNEKFYVCFSNKNVNFVEYNNGEVIHTIKCNDIISCVCLSQNDRKVSIALINGSLEIYSVLSNKILRKLHFSNPVIHCCFDGTSTFLVMGFGNGQIRIFDVNKGICTHFYYKHSSRLGMIKFHPKELVVFSSSIEGVVIFDVINEKFDSIFLESQLGVVLGLEFTKDGSKFVTTAVNKIFCVFSYKEKKLLKKIRVFDDFTNIQIVEKNLIKNLCNSDDFNGLTDEIIISGASNGNIYMCDLNGKIVLENKFIGGGLQYSYFLEKKREILFTTDDCNFIVFDVENCVKKRQILGFEDEVLDVSFLSVESNEFAVATNTNNIIIFNLTSKNSVFLKGHTNMVISLDVSHDNRFLVSGSKDKTVRVWQVLPNQKRCVAIGDSHTGEITSVCTGKKSSRFFVSVAEDKTLKKYEMNELFSHLKKFNNKNLKATDILPMSCLTVRAHNKDITDVTISPDETLIATSSMDKTVKIWNSKDLKLVKIMSHQSGVYCLKFSQVEKVIATGSSDNFIRIWSVSSGGCLKVLEGHTSSILNVCFVNLGLQLLSASSNGLVKLWTIKTNECVKTFNNHKNKIWAFACRNDGRELITGGEDSKINVWKENSKETNKEIQKIREKEVVKKQELENLLNEKNYKEALKLSIELDQPRNTYNIFMNMIQNQVKFNDVIKKLSYDNINYLFQFCVDWNTNTKFSKVAHTVLRTMFEVFQPNFVSWEYEKSLDSLIVYSQKHLKRINKLLENTFVLDYVLAQMKQYDSVKENEMIEENTNNNDTTEKISLTNPEFDSFEKENNLLDENDDDDDDEDVIMHENITQNIENRKRKREDEESEEGKKKRKIITK